MNKKIFIFITCIIILVVVILIFTNINSKIIMDDDNNSIQSYIPNYEEVNRNPEKVTIEILENTVKRNSLKIIITDNNEYKYGWTYAFRIQKKVDGNWQELEKVSDDMSFYGAVYEFDKNNKMLLQINCEKYYGILENGIYRIVKPVYDIGYFLVDLYSDEFTIK